jgi:choline kinase
LVGYTIDALAAAGITVLNAVIGYESALLVPGLRKLIPAGMQLWLIENRQWQKQNGLSVLAAAKHVTGPFLLTMADHMFADSIVDLVLGAAEPDRLNIAIDRKLDSICDIDDAMKVETSGEHVVGIGKDLAKYDAIDTGLFVCSPEIFDYLERAKKDNDCSLADGVRLMAAANKVRWIDIGDAWWHDVNTPLTLEHAENQFPTRQSPPVPPAPATASARG